MTAPASLPRDGAALRKVALAYPGASESMPWGHSAIKVNGKSFVFLSADDGTFSLSAKLPSSSGVALGLPFAASTGYGLGKSGWVTARFPLGTRIPVALLSMWIDESYRAIAPKRLVARLEPVTVPAAKKKKKRIAPRSPRRKR